MSFIEDILNKVKTGEITIEAAAHQLKNQGYEDIGFAKIDHHREIRTGFPEVVFCQGKTAQQVSDIMKHLAERHEVVLATRASKEQYEAVAAEMPSAIYHDVARIIQIGTPRIGNPEKYVLVVSAGTADIPVAEEAAITAIAMGSRVERLFDVGVAGIHRLFTNKDIIDNANVIVAVAGMEGALISVIGGLVDIPVVAVPTSVGYGASFKGVAALLSMLNTCAEGVAVVNIDNGFGAGYFAHIINK